LDRMRHCRSSRVLPELSLSNPALVPAAIQMAEPPGRAAADR
jgi:hypothetical protein